MRVLHACLCGACAPSSGDEDGSGSLSLTFESDVGSVSSGASLSRKRGGQQARVNYRRTTPRSSAGSGSALSTPTSATSALSTPTSARSRLNRSSSKPGSFRRVLLSARNLTRSFTNAISSFSARRGVRSHKGDDDKGFAYEVDDMNPYVVRYDREVRVAGARGGRAQGAVADPLCSVLLLLPL